MPDPHDLQRIRTAILALMDAAIFRTKITDEELISFVRNTAGAETLLHPDEVAWINELKGKATQLKRVNRSLNETGSPAKKSTLTTWFWEQKTAFINRQLQVHPDLLSGLPVAGSTSSP